MKRITALPIRGESYLLEYAGRRILIDGGYKASTLVPVLKKQLGASTIHLDVVVCTHSDSDHAGGLTNLLDQPGITAAEFWLPGSWKESVKELVEETERFYKELRREIKAETGIEALCAEDDEQVDRELARLTSNVWVSDADKAIGEPRNLALEPAKRDGKTTAAAKAKRAIRNARTGPANKQRILDLIDTAERIREIALSASVNSVPVRWFDYLAYSRHRVATGGEDFLRPVNARELREPPTLPGFAFCRFLALSRANRESLAYLSSGDDAHVDVLFCGDSPLGDGRGYVNSFLAGKGTNKPLIVTAPHHGADSNAMAYGHIAGFGEVSFWIRAGGKPYHPQSAYRTIPGGARTCTHCPHHNLPLQAVCITDKCESFTDPQAWLTVRSHDCLC